MTKDEWAATLDQFIVGVSGGFVADEYREEVRNVMLNLIETEIAVAEQRGGAASLAIYSRTLHDMTEGETKLVSVDGIVTALQRSSRRIAENARAMAQAAAELRTN